ncbi:MAG TPA: PspC domain-containing protein [Micromonosporaceae bacterium]|jgi:phage shock protein PspC (stress-responsive transcriptional regulator)|nr:PspC domain-containing protein [Micromonosporaceae bacterium]
MTENSTDKRLVRPRGDRMLGGVCSGVARYFGVDPTVVRLAFVVVALVTWGVALLAYPIMWIIMPEEAAPIPTA